MKHVLTIFMLLLAGCGARSIYDVRLESVEVLNAPKISPEVTTPVSFEDKDVHMTIAFGGSGINFVITNKSKQVIRLPWDEVVFTSPNSGAMRVMHSGIKYISRDQPQPATIIPPGSKVSDIITPTENISYTSGRYGGWSTEDLLTDESIGKSPKIYFPLTIGETKREYSMAFIVKQRIK